MKTLKLYIAAICHRGKQATHSVADITLTPTSAVLATAADLALRARDANNAARANSSARADELEVAAYASLQEWRESKAERQAAAEAAKAEAAVKKQDAERRLAAMLSAHRPDTPARRNARAAAHEVVDVVSDHVEDTVPRVQDFLGKIKTGVLGTPTTA